MKLISTMCDIHKGEHEGVERAITIDGSPFVLDVCDGFVSELKSRSMSNTLDAALNAPAVGSHSPNGQVKPKAAVAAKKPVPAKLARKAVAALAADANGMRAGDAEFPCFICPETVGQSGFQSHAKTHGFATGGDMTGDHCPLCGVQHGRLTNHAKEQHGVANVALLFQTAKRDGDKFGIIAKRIKAAKTKTPVK